MTQSIDFDGPDEFFTINGKEFYIATRGGRCPEVWVHAVKDSNKSGDALLYLRGSSLTDGTDEENFAYLMEIITRKLDLNANSESHEP